MYLKRPKASPLIYRLLQGQYPRHTLVKQTSKSSETALSAFNPPKDAASSSTLPAFPSDSRGKKNPKKTLLIK